MIWRRTFAAAFLLLTLGSCSRVFQVTAAIIGNAIVFKSKDDRRTSYPWCWNSFALIDDQAEPVWEFEVPYGAFSGNEDCGPNFPIRYGDPPERAETIIAPQPLEIGRLYVIQGHSAGSLEGAFKIERVGSTLKIRNLDPNSTAALSIRDAYFAWQRDHDPLRISESEPLNAAFVVQPPPENVPRDAAAGASGRDDYTWVLHPDPWWNLPSLGYQDLSGNPAPFNLWCRYTDGPIYARVPPPASKSSILNLISGSERLSVRLIGAGSPTRGDRVDAVLPGNTALFENFARTGTLSVELAGRLLEANAVNGEERAVVNRFFALCRSSEHGPANSGGER